MKKIIFSLILLLTVFTFTGCGKKNEAVETISNNETNNQVETQNNETTEPEVEESKLTEGKYIQIAPSREGSEGEGYDSYLTLEDGKATEYETYFEITTEGTYTVEDNVVTVHFTRNYGMTTYGEPFDDQIDRIFTYHTDGDLLILDKMNDFEAYDAGTIVFKLT